MLIGELSRRTGVSPRLLRYHEEQGLLHVTRRANGYRDYDDDAVTVLQRVRTLLDAGLPTEVIRSVLPCVRGAGLDLDWCAELRTLLTSELRALDERIDDLRRRRGALAGYLTHS
jgi:DNA-binding transcriptional MerR regulator